MPGAKKKELLWFELFADGEQNGKNGIKGYVVFFVYEKILEGKCFPVLEFY